MTSDLEQIAEEMELADTGSPMIETWAARIRAWIAANKESPQRKEFVEAAMEYGHALRFDGSARSVGRSYIHKCLSDLQDAYHAMIEAEKVEAERGEGT